MGWGSASGIFNVVADELIASRANEAVVERICLRLARELMDGDWDTEDESIGQFAGHPAVQHAIYRARGYCSLYDVEGEPAGRLEYDPAGQGAWVLYDKDNEEMARGSATVAGFNRVIGTWAAGCNGNAEEYLLQRG